MASHQRKKKAEQKVNSNGRAPARRKGQKMAKNSGKAAPVVELKDGQFQIVEASGYSSNYDCRVLLALDYQHPKSERISDLKRWTGYAGGVTQFEKTVIQKLRKDGRVCVDNETNEVSITPVGRHFVRTHWPELPVAN